MRNMCQFLAFCKGELAKRGHYADHYNADLTLRIPEGSRWRSEKLMIMSDPELGLARWGSQDFNRSFHYGTRPIEKGSEAIWEALEEISLGQCYQDEGDVVYEHVGFGTQYQPELERWDQILREQFGLTEWFNDKAFSRDYHNGFAVFSIPSFKPAPLKMEIPNTILASQEDVDLTLTQMRESRDMFELINRTLQFPTTGTEK